MVGRVMADMVVIKTVPLGNIVCDMWANFGFLPNVGSEESSGDVANLPTFLLLNDTAHVAIVLTCRPHFSFLPDMGTPQDTRVT